MFAARLAAVAAGAGPPQSTPADPSPQDCGSVVGCRCVECLKSWPPTAEAAKGATSCVWRIHKFKGNRVEWDFIDGRDGGGTI